MIGMAGAGVAEPDLSSGRVAAGLGVVSASILLLEVGSTRLLSFVSWHHFAFMVVSVAMLGLGAASVVLAVWRGAARVSLSRLCTIGAVAQGIATVLAYTVLVTARFSPVRLPTELWPQLIRLALTYTALVLPFLAGGLVVAACLSRRASRASLLYGGDLMGAALGSLAGVALAGPLSVEQAVIASGALAVIGGAIFAWPKPLRLVSAGVVVLGLFAVCGTVTRVLPARPAPGKSMQAILEERDPPGRILSSHNTPLGRVDVIETPEEVVWSRNPRADERGPRQLRIVIDGDAATPVALFDDFEPEDLEYLDFLPSSFVFALRRPERALILGAGGGQDVLSALRFGVEEIDAVEINPALIRLMRGRLADRSGRVYQRPGVNLIRAEGRSFVRRSDERYDVVQMGLVDTWAATSLGGLSLTENFLYTVDAFEDYLAALRPGGVLGITRWIQRPPRETLRLAVLAVTALERRGVADPAAHIAVVGVGRVGALIVSREPLTEEQRGRISELARRYRLDVVYLPGRDPEGPTAEIFHRLLEADDRDAFIDRYPFDISPVGDDQPFFFDFNTPRGLGLVSMLFQPSVAALSGTATLVAVLIQSVILSLVLLGIPLLARRTRIRRDGVPLVAYFAATGTGFMFLEIPLLQRLTLVIGHPTQAVALVLVVLLGASGLASLWSGRITGHSRRRAKVVLLGLAALAVLEAIFGTLVGQSVLSAPGGIRALVGALLVLPLGLLMGLPTPHGLRVASGIRPDLLPLLWATTSFASVVGAVLAVMVSMGMGFAMALGFGAVCYAAAGLLAPGSSTSAVGESTSGPGLPLDKASGVV